MGWLRYSLGLMIAPVLPGLFLDGRDDTPWAWLFVRINFGPMPAGNARPESGAGEPDEAPGRQLDPAGADRQLAGGGVHVHGVVEAGPGDDPGVRRLGDVAEVGERQERGAARVGPAVGEDAGVVGRPGAGDAP